MIHSFYLAVGENLVVAAILAAAVYGITRVWRNPTVRHALWLLVLLKLIVPPLYSIRLVHTSLGPAADAVHGVASMPAESLASADQAVAVGSTAQRAEAPSPVNASDAPEGIVADSRISNLSPGVVLALIWATGSAVWLAIAGVRIFRFHRQVERAAVAGEEICKMAADVARELGYRHPLDVRVSAGEFPPFLWAVGHPRIVLPRFALTELTTTQLQGILAHEIAHLLRRDHWVRWVELGIFACYWRYPIVWWARRELRIAEEQACDARVVRVYAGIDTSYVEALIAVIDRIQTPAHPISAMASPLGGEGTLKQRVEAIVAGGDWRVGKMAVAALAMVAISLFCSVQTSADQPPPAALAEPPAAESPVAAPSAAVPSAAVPVEMLSKTIRVVDAQGAPIAGATVVPWAIRTVKGSHGPWRLAGLGDSEPPTLTTDADGRATIPFPRFAQRSERILPRELTCRVEHPGYALTDYNDVIVMPDELEKVQTIVLQTGARVEVVAFDGDRPLPMDRVRAQWSSPGMSDSEPSEVNPAGRLELPRLPPGTELLRLAYFPEQGPMLLSEVETLHLANDKRKELRIEMKPTTRAEGRLDASVPRPIKNGRVVAEIIDKLEMQSLNWTSYANIREDGTFVLENLPYGDLQVIALCEGFMAESGAPPKSFDPVGQGSLSGLRPQVFPLTDAKNEIVVEMVPTASCQIRVLGPDNHPVADALCSFWPNVHWWYGGSQLYCAYQFSSAEGLKDPKQWKSMFKKSGGMFSATTNASGIAVVYNLPAEQRHFVVRHEGLELPISDPQSRYATVELQAGQQTDVTVKLQEKGKQFIGSQ
jgi:beta-lactamase regulating signal transducer with metallopeptidase domain